jgi:hypothetical protein
VVLGRGGDVSAEFQAALRAGSRDPSLSWSSAASRGLHRHLRCADVDCGLDRRVAARWPLPLPPRPCPLPGGSSRTSPLFEGILPLAGWTPQPPQACLSSRTLAPCWTCGSSSLGLRPLCLAADIGPSVHSRFGVAAYPSASPCQETRPVPPSRFLTALTACSARTLRVCCAPLPVRGSPRFSRSSSGPEGPDAFGLPRDAYYPSKDSPRR